METGGKREANFELLRIVAMLMIIAIHYLVKGYFTLPAAENDTAVTYLAKMVEAFCIESLNCYVLISGYFLGHGKLRQGKETESAQSGDSFLAKSWWRPERALSLVWQVLFYSLALPFLLIALGVVSLQELTIYDWIGFCFPLGTEHYWFATAYLALYLLATFLAAGLERLEKRQLQAALLLLFLFFSLEKTILPVRLATDRYGYDFGWLLCLFLLGGYLRRYGLPWLEKKGRAALVYVLACLGIFGLSLLSERLGGYIDAFSYYAEMPYTLNHALCLLGSVALFYAFRNLRIREGRAAELIRRLAPCTFGVYLLHEHILVRNQWMRWLGIEGVSGFWLFPHMLFCVLVVYAAGTAVELLRGKAFRSAAQLRLKQKRER